MRIAILNSLLGLSLVACAGNISGGAGGDDDDDIPETCGNGVVDPGEDCDGGETCSATCTSVAVPRVALSVDSGSMTTDLEAENVVVVTATAMDGFTGGVVLSASVVDGANATITGWVTEFDTTTLDLTSATTATAQLKVTIPGNNDFMTGTIKVTSSSSAAPAETTVAVTASPIVRISFNANNGQCVYPQRGVNNPYRVKAGREVRVYNNAAAGTMTIHAGGVTGFGHQNVNTANAPGAFYAGTTTTAGQQADFYCHAGNAGTLGEGDPNLHPFLKTE